MNPHHEANRIGWNAVSREWQTRVDQAGIWKLTPTQSELVFRPEELRLLGEITGKNVCVLGSGDNLAVFALAGRALP